jgi:hypothetical protein
MPTRTSSHHAVRLAREAKPAWSTTASAGWDAATAAHDDAGALGEHAETCQQSHGRLRALFNALYAVHRVIQPRTITLLVGVLVAAAAVAMWLE